MLKQIKNVLKLIDYPYRGKFLFAIFGAAFVSLIEMLGVGASYPLLLLVSGAEIREGNGVIGIIASFFNTSNRQTLIAIMGGMVAVSFVLKSIVSITFRWWQLGFVNQLEKTARVNLFKGYIYAPYKKHRQKQVPDLHANLAAAISQSYGQVILGSISFFSSSLTAFLLLLVIFYVSPVAATVALFLFGGAGVIIPIILRRRLNQISADVVEAERIAWYASIPAFQAFREMRLFDVSDNFIGKYRLGAEKRASVNRRNSFYSELPKYLTEIIFILGVVSLSLILFNLYPSAQAVSIMGVFTVAAIRMLPSVNGAIASANLVRAGRSGLHILDSEVNQVITHESTNKNFSKGTDFKGDINLYNVSFSYGSGQKKVLDDISLHIPYGSTVAFVGPSGSGKSTLVDIVLGLMEPDEGKVTAGEKDIKSDIRAWQDQLGVVPQNVVMIPGDLRKNIAFGLESSDINDSKVLEAVRATELEELVDSLPNGIYENLGQEGNRLSGGQKQRVGIARALYRSPKVLVMDEATSALDNKTEYKITKTVDNLKGQQTTIIVAHRLSTIKNADNIYYLRGGRLLGQGNFQELEKKIPEFSELVRLGKI
ncbi:ABC transporter ATP-binding protein [Rothia sp. ZJ932]|uniref:ABC transporter ATP-binding protein n=1 Tax=Rothia sp. ZJ932 TaxID=2810516 RepID=UPI001967662E|nr:ABC transporter ATP-binding protein [Rothia sp. ZJ932]QRZ61208.1 ABC transporter ATP-binding protein [Rothia sp. ZJ932]